MTIFEQLSNQSIILNDTEKKIVDYIISQTKVNEKTVSVEELYKFDEETKPAKKTTKKSADKAESKAEEKPAKKETAKKTVKKSA